MKIAFYVSDHGYGHATRSIGLIREMAAAGVDRLEIEVVNHHAHDLLTQGLAGLEGVRTIDRATDIGFLCQPDRLAFDPGRTALAIFGWISGWKAFVASEVDRLRARPPDLVISDVAPEPLLVAEKLGVPSVVASNFTWVDQYEPHVRPDLIAPLRGSYALALRGYAYALRTALSGVRSAVPAGLVTREPRCERRETRSRLGVEEGQVLVHLGFGWSEDAVHAAEHIASGAAVAEDVRLLVSSNLGDLLRASSPAGIRERILTIAANDTEAHEAIAACDLVLAKAGYGTVSEAIAGRVPILAVPVVGSPESEVIARTVAQLGIGVSYPGDAPWGVELFREASRMLDGLDRYKDAYRRLPAELAPGAAARLARTLLTLAEDPS